MNCISFNPYYFVRNRTGNYHPGIREWHFPVMGIFGTRHSLAAVCQYQVAVAKSGPNEIFPSYL